MRRKRKPSLLQSFIYACAGLTDLLRHERNARIHLLATALVVPTGIYAGIGLRDWALLTLVIGFVWSAEAVNSALERLADAVTLERHPLIGRAKDLAAAAVLIAALTAIVAGGMILIPPLLARGLP